MDSVVFLSLRGTKQSRIPGTWIATSFVTGTDSFLAMTDHIASRAWEILSRSLLWIAFSVASLRLCIPTERRLTPRASSHSIYSLVISSGLHSKDISVNPPCKGESGGFCFRKKSSVFRLTSDSSFAKGASRKHSSISRTSSSESTDGVPPPKYIVPGVCHREEWSDPCLVFSGSWIASYLAMTEWKYSRISLFRCAIYRRFFASSKIGVSANLQYGHFCRQKGMWR